MAASMLLILGSVKELRALGIQPDILLCRAERFLPADMKDKIALFCDVDPEAVITAKDVSSVYEIPLVFAEEKVDEIILRHLHLDVDGPRNLEKWGAMLHRMQNPVDSVDIALVGKYVEYEDSYKSLKEALLHGGIAHGLKVTKPLTSDFVARPAPRCIAASPIARASA